MTLLGRRQNKSTFPVTSAMIPTSVRYSQGSSDQPPVTKRKVTKQGNKAMLQLLVKLTGRTRTNARALGLLLMIVVAAEPSICQAGGIVNGGFSTPDISRPGQNAGEPKGLIKFFPPSEVTGWKTTDTAFEIWSDGANVGMQFLAPPGYKQWAEVNATKAGTLSQTVSGIGVGNNFGFSFYHRGRQSATEGDVIQVTVVDTVTNVTLLDKQFSTTNAAWLQYKVPMGVKQDDHPLLLSFKAVSSAGGNVGIGNFLTGVVLGESFAAPLLLDPETMLAGRISPTRRSSTRGGIFFSAVARELTYCFSGHPTPAHTQPMICKVSGPHTLD